MQFAYHHKIGIRLGFGFVIVVGLTILLGIMALIEMSSLAKVTRDLYNHPMVVSNAIRDIRGNVLAIHRSMNDIVLARSDRQLQDAIHQINQEEQAALQSFDTLYARFLGDKADIDSARRAFLEWKPARDEMIGLIQSGSKDQAAQIGLSQGDQQALYISEKLQIISDFAKQKALEFFNRAQKTERLHVWTMSAMAVLVAIVGIAGGFLITRSITRPLAYVVEQIGKVAAGDLDHKINLNSGDEIGQLSRAFDDMTASLKKITASRNELDAANQQLGASNEQLRAHEQQLRAANQQLRASEQHCESIVSTIPGIVYRLHMDDQGVFSIPYISRQAESIIGHPLNILTNSDCFFDIIHSEDVENFRSAILDSSRTLEPCIAEFRVFDTNGRMKWLKNVSTPQRFTGNSTIWNGIIIDITDRKQDEVRLLESEERYRIVADNTYNWEFWMDPDERYVYISPSCQRITGYTVEEFKTDPDLLKAIIHPDDRQSYQAHCVDARTRYAAGNIEFRIIRKDQQVCWIEHLCRPIFDKHGKWLGIRGSNRDVTDRKQAEEAVLVSEVRYRRLFEAAHDGILILEADSGQIVDVNPFIKNILGYSHEELLNKKLWEIGFFKNIAASKEAFLELQNNEYIRHENLPLETKDGYSIAVEFVSNVYLVDHQKVIQCNIRDITKRVRAEEAHRQSEAFIKLVMDNLPIGIAVNSVSPAVTFSYMNDNFPKIYRTTREALANPDCFWEAVYEEPDFREEIKKRVLDDCASGDPGRMKWADVPITRRGHETTFVTAMDTPVSDKPLLISTVWDVTDRKLAQAQLQESEAKFRLITRNTPDHVLIQDRDLRYTFVLNPQLGLTEADMLGKTDFDFLTAQDAEKLAVVKRKVFETGQAVAYSTSLKGSDGREEFFEGTYVPKLDAGGHVDGLIGYFRNVTERRQIDEKLRQQLVELQRWHDITLNREDRVLELKKEVNGLLEKLGQPVRYNADIRMPVQAVDTAAGK